MSLVTNPKLHTLNSKQLLVIVGPTASGKSELAMRVARNFKGEIICADSRTVYKDLDIGTAKPSFYDRRDIPHHLLDVVEPNEIFNAAIFKKLAKEKIVAIKTQGKLPVLVGGTGLFIDAVLYDYTFGPPADVELRATLNSLDVEDLQEVCKTKKINLPRNYNNKRHLIRCIEQNGIKSTRNNDVINNTNLVGLFPEHDILKLRIRNRAEQIFSNNVVEETIRNAKKYGWDAPGLSGNIYPIIRRLLANEISEQQAKDLFIAADWQLARRQMTWFRRNKDIQRFENVNEAYAYIEQVAQL